MDTTGTPTLAHGGSFRTLSGANPTCTVGFVVFEVPGCTGSRTQIISAGSVPALPTLGSFDQYHEEQTVLADTESVQLSLYCEAATDFVVLMDNIYIGVGLAVPVELQSFSVD